MSKQLAAVYSRIDGVERKWVSSGMLRGRGYELDAEFHEALGLEVSGDRCEVSEPQAVVVRMDNGKAFVRAGLGGGEETMTLEKMRKTAGAELSRALNEALAKHQERMQMRDEYMASLPDINEGRAADRHPL